MAYLRFKFPFPPSLRSPEAIDAFDRKKISAQCRGAKLDRKNRYAIEMFFHANWDNQDGTPKRRDVHNYISKLADVLAAAVQIDDSQFVSWKIEQVQDTENEFADVTIRDCRWRRCA